MPGTAADLTVPPVTGSPAQASSKAAAPIDNPPAAVAKALANRRESATLEEAQKLAAMKDGDLTKSQKAQKEKAAEAVKLREFVQDDRHFSLVRNFRLADIVTLGNGFCGALSLFSSAKYLISHDQTYIWHALTYPLAGFIFDALDGKVARWRRESSMLGQELDSLADSISFGVAPAFLAFTLGLRTPLDTVFLTLFICAGIARLARFNATVALIPKDTTGKSKYFEGLPIPSSLILVALMAVSVKRGNFDGVFGQGDGLPLGLVGWAKEKLGISVHWEAVVFAGWAAAMISKTLRIPKL